MIWRRETRLSGSAKKNELQKSSLLVMNACISVANWLSGIKVLIDFSRFS